MAVLPVRRSQRVIRCQRRAFHTLAGAAMAALIACSDAGPVHSVGDEVHRELEEIYKSADAPRFDAFLEMWAASRAPASGSEREQMNDTARAIYEIFEVFWDPRSLDRFGDSERYPALGDRYYEGAQYAILQTKIEYWMYRAPASSMVALADFRPNVHVEGLKILPLSQEHLGGIISFLEGGPSVSDRLARRSFLDARLRSIMSGTHNDWHLLMFPEARWVTFQPGLEAATISFRIGLEGGTAFFERIDGQWEMVRSRMSWFERWPPY